jgi:hypothetical protein
MTDNQGQPAEPQAVDSFPTPDPIAPENVAKNDDASSVPENPAHPVADEDPEEHIGDELPDPWKSGDQNWASVEDDSADKTEENK